MHAKSLIALAVILATSSCGGGGSPTNPTPTPSALALAIIGNTGLRTGQTETFRADVSMSNGTTVGASSPTWSSTNTNVATVSSSGAVTAVNHGSTTIGVSAQGLSTQLPIQVWQDYQGTWTGTYVITVCTHSGDFALAGWCSVITPVGTTNPFQITLTQSGGTANGTLILGAFIGTISGAVFDSRRFVGAGTATALLSSGGIATANVGTFSALSSGNTLGGNLVITFTAGSLSGQGYWEAQLSPNVVRTLSPIPVDVRRFQDELKRWRLP